MKILNNFLLITFIFAGFISCKDEDKFPYDTRDELEQGALFRTISNSGTINKNNISGSSYSITGELVSEQEVTALEFLVEYVDRNSANGNNSKDAVLVESKNVSDLSINDKGFPEASFNIEASQVLSLLSLTESQIDGDDQIIFLIEILMADGRRFSRSNTGDSVRGELFFQSPLGYVGTVVCINQPLAGDWILDMTDLYGDGWDGAKITVNLDGVLTDYTIADGSENTVTISVPSSSELFTFTYSSGNWEEEHVYTLTNPSGMLVLDEGPNPTTGELLNKCQ